MTDNLDPDQPAPETHRSNAGVDPTDPGQIVPDPQCAPAGVSTTAHTPTIATTPIEIPANGQTPLGQPRAETQPTGAGGTIYDRIAAEADAHPDLDDDEVAVRVLKGIPRLQWRTILLPLVSRAVQHHRRRNVRSEEGRILRLIRKRRDRQVTVVAGGYEPDVVELRALLKLEFNAAGEMVRWGKATVEQHQTRVTEQTRLRNGVQADIDRHLLAITVITEAGASCLDDVLEAA